jgi:hypothetical protein
MIRDIVASVVFDQQCLTFCLHYKHNVIERNVCF